MNLFCLNKPKSYEQSYLKMMMDGLLKRIRQGVGSKNKVELKDTAKEILVPGWNTKNPDTSIIERLLIAEPDELILLNNEIEGKLKKLCRWNRPGTNQLLKIFGYERTFDDSSKKRAFDLASAIGTNTCCYCNRQYIFTVVDDRKKDEDGNKIKAVDRRIARPTFDHWFPKNEYPLLSVSLYNLIPSCTICNSSVKGTHDVNLKDYIHPYVHYAGHPAVKFKYEPSAEPTKKWTIKIDRVPQSPEDKTIRMFCLDQIYKMHDNLELKDLMDFKEKYPPDYLNDLIKLLQSESIGQSLSLQEVYRILFGAEYDDAKALDHPLGKMKNDIVKELLNVKY